MSIHVTGTITPTTATITAGNNQGLLGLLFVEGGVIGFPVTITQPFILGIVG